jgi:hypothetical protein
MDSPWAGAAISMVLVVWEGFWIIGPPLGLTSHDRNAYLCWGLVGLVISGCQAFSALLRENSSLKNKLDDKQRTRRARELIGGLLEQLADCEREAYDGSSASEYDKLLGKIEQLKRNVREIATEYLDTSFESRFLAVNVLDVQLDTATKMHFIDRAQGNFWTMYQQLKGWRACLSGILQELSR